MTTIVGLRHVMGHATEIDQEIGELPTTTVGLQKAVATIGQTIGARAIFPPAGEAGAVRRVVRAIDSTAPRARDQTARVPSDSKKIFAARDSTAPDRRK
jgi:hypothetical protein